MGPPRRGPSQLTGAKNELVYALASELKRRSSCFRGLDACMEVAKGV